MVVPHETFVRYDGQGVVSIVHDGVRAIQRIDVAEQMMWNIRTFVERRFRRGDVQTFVDLHRIGVDNFAVETFGQMNG